MLNFRPILLIFFPTYTPFNSDLLTINPQATFRKHVTPKTLQ